MLHSDQRSISAIIKDIDAAFETHHQVIKKEAQKLYNALDDFERGFYKERYISLIKKHISDMLRKSKGNHQVKEHLAWIVINASPNIVKQCGYVTNYKLFAIIYVSFDQKIDKIFDSIIDSPLIIIKEIIANLLNALKIKALFIAPDYPSLDSLYTKFQSERNNKIQQLKLLSPEIAANIKIFEDFSNQAPQHLNALLEELENNLDSVSYQDILQFSVIEPSSDAFHQKSCEIAEKMFARFSQQLTKEKMDDLLKFLDNPKITSLDLSIIEKVIFTKLELIEKPQIEFIVSKLSKYEKRENNEYIEKLVLQPIANKKYSVNDLINRLMTEQNTPTIRSLLSKIIIQAPHLIGPVEIENLIKEPSEYLHVNSRFDLLILAIDKRNDLINADVLDALITKIKKHSGLFGYFNQAIELLFYGIYIIATKRVDLIKGKEEEIIKLAIQDDNKYTGVIFNQLIENNYQIIDRFIFQLNHAQYQVRRDASMVLSGIIEINRNLVKIDQFELMLRDEKAPLEDEFLKFFRDLVMEYPGLVQPSIIQALSYRNERLAIDIYLSYIAALGDGDEDEDIGAFVVADIEISQVRILPPEITQEVIINNRKTEFIISMADVESPFLYYVGVIFGDYTPEPPQIKNSVLMVEWTYIYRQFSILPKLKKVIYALPIFQYCWEEILYLPKVILPEFMYNSYLWIGIYASVSFAAKDFVINDLVSYSSHLLLARNNINGHINNAADFAHKCFAPVVVPSMLGIITGYDNTINAIVAGAQCYQAHNKGYNTPLTFFENIIPYVADAAMLFVMWPRIENLNLNKFITIASYVAMVDYGTKLMVNEVKESAHNYVGECYQTLFWMQEV